MPEYDLPEILEADMIRGEIGVNSKLYWHDSTDHNPHGAWSQAGLIAGYGQSKIKPETSLNIIKNAPLQAYQSFVGMMFTTAQLKRTALLAGSFKHLWSTEISHIEYLDIIRGSNVFWTGEHIFLALQRKGIADRANIEAQTHPKFHPMCRDTVFHRTSEGKMSWAILNDGKVTIWFYTPEHLKPTLKVEVFTRTGIGVPGYRRGDHHHQLWGEEYVISVGHGNLPCIAEFMVKGANKCLKALLGTGVGEQAEEMIMQLLRDHRAGKLTAPDGDAAWLAEQEKYTKLY